MLNLSRRGEAPYPYTQGVQEVLAGANDEAQRFNHYYLGTEHLLLGLLTDRTPWLRDLLNTAFDVRLAKVRSAVEFIVGRGDRSYSGELGFTSRAKRVLELGTYHAGKQKLIFDTSHILEGMILEGEGIACGVLEAYGISLHQLRERKFLESIRDAEKKAGLYRIADDYIAIFGADSIDEVLRRTATTNLREPVFDILSRLRVALSNPNLTENQRALLMSRIENVVDLANNPDRIIEVPAVFDINNLPLEAQIKGPLRRSGITTRGQLDELAARGFKGVRNIGIKRREELARIYQNLQTA